MLIKLSENIAINPEFLSYIVEETTGIDRVRRIARSTSSSCMKPPDSDWQASSLSKTIVCIFCDSIRNCSQLCILARTFAHFGAC